MWRTVSFLLLFVEGSHVLGHIRDALQPQGSQPRHRDGERGLGNAAGLMPQEGGGARQVCCPFQSHGGASKSRCLCVWGVCVCCGEAHLGIFRPGTLVLFVIRVLSPSSVLNGTFQKIFHNDQSTCF